MARVAIGFRVCTRPLGAIRRGGCMGATRTAATARSAASGSLRATVAVVAAAASAAAAAAAEAAASPFGMRNLVEQRLGGNRSSSQPEEPLVTTSSLLSGFKQHVRPLLELNAFLEREVVSSSSPSSGRDAAATRRRPRRRASSSSATSRTARRRCSRRSRPSTCRAARASRRVARWFCSCAAFARAAGASAPSSRLPRSRSSASAICPKSRARSKR